MEGDQILKYDVVQDSKQTYGGGALAICGVAVNDLV
jgi:hypothetical protein